MVQDLEGKSRERQAAEEGESGRAEALEREGRWAEATAVYREQLASAADPDFVSRCQAGLARCQEEAALAQLFDDGVAAGQRGEWPRAQEILTRVVRRRPEYERGGQQAAAWLAETERQLGPPPDRRQVVWWSIAGGIVVLLILTVLGGGGYAIIKSRANRAAAATAVAVATVHADETAVAGTQATGTAVVEQTATAQIEATGTAVAQQTATAQAAAMIPTQAPAEEEGMPPVQPDPPHAFLLMDDDFSNSDSGWDRVEDADQNLDYENGEYIIQVKHEGWSAQPSGGQETFSDFTLETDVRLQEGSESATFGLVFRRQDQGNYYRFVIDGGGRYKLEKVQAGTGTPVAGTEWRLSPHIHTGKATNHLVVVCFGPQTSLYANGHHLTTVQDETFNAGQVGVTAETTEGSDPIRVVFDNLKAYVPYEAVPPVQPSPAHVFLHISDDFGDPGSGWQIADDSNHAKNYESGEYVILVKQDNRSAWAFGSLAWFSDFTLETDVRLVEGPSSARAGAVFWYVDDDNYHCFYINGQGQYGVARVQAGKTVGIIEQKPSPHIQSEGVNHLKVVSAGTRISLYVNEHYLGTVQVDAAGEGRAGLYAQRAEGSDLVKVAFDNVRVYAADRPPVKPIPPHTQLLYSDDFANPASGWVSMASELLERYYENGEYAVMVKQEDMRAAATGTEDAFSDFTLEADARLAGGPVNGSYGLLFRYRDSNNYYYFVVNGEGWYQVAKVQNGAVSEMVEWTFSPAIRTGNTPNHLQVVGFGSEMSFHVNEQHLATIQDDTFERGNIGVIAVTATGSGPVKASFDNLRLYGPGETQTRAPTPVSPAPSHEAAPIPAAEPVRPNKIAFVSDRDGNHEIYVMRADGRGGDPADEQRGLGFNAFLVPVSRVRV